MSTPTASIDERWLDASYRDKAPLPHRIIIAMFRHHINDVVKTVIGRAFERCVINSHQLHEMGAISDRITGLHDPIP